MAHDQAPHSLLRREQTVLVRDTLPSIFCVHVNLNHLLAKEKDFLPKHDEAKRKYYLKTSQVDRDLPETPELEMQQLLESKKGKRAKKSKGQKGVTDMVGSCEPTSHDDEGTKGPKHSHRNDGQRNSTGFVIARYRTTLRILTCAHTIDEVYGQDVHDITIDDANLFYTFEVHCSHQELHILNQLNEQGSLPINELDRWMTQCRVVAIDTAKDLMVLELDVRDIHYTSSNDTCWEYHPVISMADAALAKLELCILQGWPPQRLSSLSVGQLCFESRSYEAVTQENKKGYNMKLSEFTKMEGDDGCSGAPAINGMRRCSGVYHGTVGTKAYIVNATDVIHFLQRFRMLTDWDVDEDIWFSHKYQRRHGLQGNNQ